MARINKKGKKLQKPKGEKLTFHKRRNKIMKKVLELSVKCGVDAACICFSPADRLNHFAGYKRTEDVLIRMINSREPHIEQLVSQNKEYLLNLLKKVQKITVRYYDSDFSYLSGEISRVVTVINGIKSDLRSYEPSAEEIKSSREAEVHEAFLENALKAVRERMGELTLNTQSDPNIASSSGVNHDYLLGPNGHIQGNDTRQETLLDSFKAIEDAFEMDEAVPEEAITSLEEELIRELMGDEPRGPNPNALNGANQMAHGGFNHPHQSDYGHVQEAANVQSSQATLVGTEALSSFTMEEPYLFSYSSLFPESSDLQELWTLDDALWQQPFSAQEGPSSFIQLDQQTHGLDQAASFLQAVQSSSVPTTEAFYLPQSENQTSVNQMMLMPDNDMIQYQGTPNPSSNPHFPSLQQGVAFSAPTTEPNFPMYAQMPFQQEYYQMPTDPGPSSWEYGESSYSSNPTPATEPNFPSNAQMPFQQGYYQIPTDPGPSTWEYGESSNSSNPALTTEPNFPMNAQMPFQQGYQMPTYPAPSTWECGESSKSRNLGYNNLTPAAQPQLQNRSDQNQLSYYNMTSAFQPQLQNSSDRAQPSYNNITYGVQPQIQTRSDQGQQLRYNNIPSGVHPQHQNSSTQAQPGYNNITSAVQHQLQHSSTQVQPSYNNITYGVQPHLQTSLDQGQQLRYNNITSEVHPQHQNSSTQAQSGYNNITSAVQNQLQNNSTQVQPSYNNITSAVQLQLQNSTIQAQPNYDNLTSTVQPQLQNRGTRSVFFPEFASSRLPIDPHLRALVMNPNGLHRSGVAPRGAGRGGFM